MAFVGMAILKKNHARENVSDFLPFVYTRDEDYGDYSEKRAREIELGQLLWSVQVAGNKHGDPASKN